MPGEETEMGIPEEEYDRVGDLGNSDEATERVVPMVQAETGGQKPESETEPDGEHEQLSVNGPVEGGISPESSQEIADFTEGLETLQQILKHIIRELGEQANSGLPAVWKSEIDERRQFLAKLRTAPFWQQLGTSESDTTAQIAVLQKKIDKKERDIEHYKQQCEVVMAELEGLNDAVKLARGGNPESAIRYSLDVIERSINVFDHPREDLDAISDIDDAPGSGGENLPGLISHAQYAVEALRALSEQRTKADHLDAMLVGRANDYYSRGHNKDYKDYPGSGPYGYTTVAYRKRRREEEDDSPKRLDFQLG